MKSILLVLSFLPLVSLSQLSLESSFNSTYVGRHQSLNLKYEWGRFSVNIGPKYHFNNRSDFPKPQAEFFRKTFWALDFSERLGFEYGFQYRILSKENVDFFVHLSSHFTRSHIRFERYDALYPLVPNPQSEYDYAYEKNISYIGPITALENNLGLGVNVLIFKNFYLTSKGGVGMMFFKNHDPANIIITSNNWELSYFGSIGLGYSFEK